ncbi:MULTISPECIES: hypothetical protein [unclassified Paenibacillus]|uniref:hypothetical protein n=1 Tax=unclassified Paenibacillus TaxID=185978 RepID=UPI003F80CD1F
MVTGISIYDTEKMNASEALEIGMSFFEAIAVSVNAATYYKFLSDGDHEGDHQLFNISPDLLQENVLAGTCDAFWLYHERKGSTPWYAAFSRETGDYGSFHHFTAFCEFPLEEVYELLTAWLADLAKQFPRFSYGILFSAEEMTRAYYYAAGNNGATVFPYENGFAFNKETPGSYQGKGRYSGEKLRMVYPCNLVNSQHLQIKIGGVKLAEWIRSGEERGELTNLGDELWLWEVESIHLDQVNQACGEAGHLLAWKPVLPRKPKRKLP